MVINLFNTKGIAFYIAGLCPGLLTITFKIVKIDENNFGMLV